MPRQFRSRKIDVLARGEILREQVDHVRKRTAVVGAYAMSVFQFTAMSNNLKHPDGAGSSFFAQKEKWSTSVQDAATGLHNVAQ